MKNEPDLTKESLMFMISPMIRVATAETTFIFNVKAFLRLSNPKNLEIR